MDKKDLDRFTQTLSYYQYINTTTRFSFRKRLSLQQQKQTLTPLVRILCYSMMPNHFHLLIEQLKEGTVGKFLSLTTNSYTKYFNARHKRSGPLFKGVFQRHVISETDQLLQVSAFIHLEPMKKGLVEDIKNFPFSSFPEYTGTKEGFCAKDTILKHFSGNSNYENYLTQPHKFEPKSLFLD